MGLFRLQQIVCCILIAIVAVDGYCGWTIDYYEFSEKTFTHLGELMEAKDFIGARKLFLDDASTIVEGSRLYNPAFWITDTVGGDPTTDASESSNGIPGIITPLLGLQPLVGNLIERHTALQTTAFGVVWQSVLESQEQVGTAIVGVSARDFIENYYVMIIANGVPQNVNDLSYGTWDTSGTRRPVHIRILAWTKNTPTAVFFFFVGGYTANNLQFFGMSIFEFFKERRILDTLSIENIKDPELHGTIANADPDDRFSLIQSLLHFDTDPSLFCEEDTDKWVSGFEFGNSFTATRNYRGIKLDISKRTGSILSKTQSITIDASLFPGVGLVQFSGTCQNTYSNIVSRNNHVTHYIIGKYEAVAYVETPCSDSLMKRPASLKDNHIAFASCIIQRRGRDPICINPDHPENPCNRKVTYHKAVEICSGFKGRSFRGQIPSTREIGRCCNQGTSYCFNRRRSLWIRGIFYFDPSDFESSGDSHVWIRDFFSSSSASGEIGNMGVIQFFDTNGELLLRNGLEGEVKYELLVDTTKAVVVDFSSDGPCNICSIKVMLSEVENVADPIVYEEEYVCGKYMGIFVEMSTPDKNFDDFLLWRNIDFYARYSAPLFGSDFHPLDDILYTFKGTICAMSSRCKVQVVWHGTISAFIPALNDNFYECFGDVSKVCHSETLVIKRKTVTDYSLSYRQQSLSGVFNVAVLWSCQSFVVRGEEDSGYRVIPRECWSSGVDFVSITPDAQRIFKFGVEVSIPLHFYHRDETIQSAPSQVKLKCTNDGDFIAFSVCHGVPFTLHTQTIMMYPSYAGLRFEDNPAMNPTEVKCRSDNDPEGFQHFRKVITITPDEQNIVSKFSKRCLVMFNTAIYGFGAFDDQLLSGGSFSWSVPQQEQGGTFTILQSKMGYPLHVQAKSVACEYDDSNSVCIIGVIVQYGRTMVSLSSRGTEEKKEHVHKEHVGVGDYIIAWNKGCWEIIGADLVTIAICKNGPFYSVGVVLPYTMLVSDVSFEPFGCTYLKSASTSKDLFAVPSPVDYFGQVPLSIFDDIRNPVFCGGSMKQLVIDSLGATPKAAGYWRKYKVDVKNFNFVPKNKNGWKFILSEFDWEQQFQVKTPSFLAMFMSQQNLFDVTLQNSQQLSHVLFRNPTMGFMQSSYQYFLYHLLITMLDRQRSWQGTVMQGWISSSLTNFLKNNQNFCFGSPPSHGIGCPSTPAPAVECTDPWKIAHTAKGSCKSAAISLFGSRTEAFETCSITPTCLGVHVKSIKEISLSGAENIRTLPEFEDSSGTGKISGFKLCHDFEVSPTPTFSVMDWFFFRPLVQCVEECNIVSRSFGVSRNSGHAMMCAFGKCAYFSNTGSGGRYNGFSWVGLPVDNQHPVVVKGWTDEPVGPVFFGKTSDCTNIQSSNRGQSWSSTTNVPVFSAYTPDFSTQSTHPGEFSLFSVFAQPTRLPPSTTPTNTINGRGSDIWWLTPDEVCLSTLVNGHVVTCCTVWICDCLDWNAWLNVFRVGAD